MINIAGFHIFTHLTCFFLYIGVAFSIQPYWRANRSSYAGKTHSGCFVKPKNGSSKWSKLQEFTFSHILLVFLLESHFRSGGLEPYWRANRSSSAGKIHSGCFLEYLDWLRRCDCTKACRSRWQDLKTNSRDIQSSMGPVQFSLAESFQILSIQVHIQTTLRCWKRGWTRSASRMRSRIRTERLNRVESVSQSLCCGRVSRMLCQTRPLQWTWVQSSQKLCGNCGVETPAPPRQCWSKQKGFMLQLYYSFICFPNFTAHAEFVLNIASGERGLGVTHPSPCATWKRGALRWL